MKSPKMFPLDYIRQQLDTFAFAGHDTSSCSLRNILFLIAVHPKVQETLHAEIDALSGAEKSYVTPDVMNGLTYLDAVIKESLRIMPPVSLIGREIVSELSVGGFVLPVGCNVFFHLYQLHRDPEQFRNPNEFIPERFFDSERHPFAFIPFSSGLRNCIGKRFGMYELKIFLIKILSKFELSSRTKFEDVRYSQGMTLQISNRIDMEFKSRI